MTAAVFEAVFSILAYFMLSSFLGRRYSLLIYAGTSVIFCAALAGLTFVSDEETWKFYTVITIGVLGRGYMTAAIGAVFVYGVELFPTSVRGSAMGVCSCIGRIGSLVAPQIIFLVRLSLHVLL